MYIISIISTPLEVKYTTTLQVTPPARASVQNYTSISYLLSSSIVYLSFSWLKLRERKKIIIRETAVIQTQKL